MLKLRSRVATYQEYFFLAGFLILFSLHSVGLGTTDVKWAAGIGLLLLGIKLVITDYTKRELLIIAVMLLAGIVPFAINSDKLLILTIVTIIAVKNCEYRKIFLYGAISRTILMAGKIGAVAIGLLPNDYNEGLTKYSVITRKMIFYNIPNFGYSHPNYLFLGAVSVALMVILVYRDRMKWKGYAVITTLLYVLYRVIYARTGFYLWICILLLVALYQFARYIKKERLFTYALAAIPVILLSGSLMASKCYQEGMTWAMHLNWTISGRLQTSTWKTRPLYEMILPQTPWMKLDNGYFYWLYNYGWLITILLIGAIVYCYFLFAKHQLYYEALVIAATTGYLIGEAMPFSTTWNPCVLLLAICIYGYTEGKATNVPKGITD